MINPLSELLGRDCPPGSTGTGNATAASGSRQAEANRAISGACLPNTIINRNPAARKRLATAMSTTLRTRLSGADACGRRRKGFLRSVPEKEFSAICPTTLEGGAVSDRRCTDGLAVTDNFADDCREPMRS